MTNEKSPCGEREALVEYLYGEISRDERARFEAHLVLCGECRDALEALRAVRAELAGWAVPEHAGSPGVMAGAHAGGWTPGAGVPGGRGGRPWWAPGALAAAAVLLLAVAAAVANLEITYGSGGVSVRTGWARQDQPQTEQPADASVLSKAEPAATPVSVPDSAASPWRDDLSALERRLRGEFRSAGTGAPRTVRAGTDAAGVLQQVQQLIEQSESRQRRELALRLAQVVRDFDAQRQTDLVRIQQGLGQIEGNTAADRQILNYLVRASQRQ